MRCEQTCHSRYWRLAARSKSHDDSAARVTVSDVGVTAHQRSNNQQHAAPALQAAEDAAAVVTPCATGR